MIVFIYNPKKSNNLFGIISSSRKIEIKNIMKMNNKTEIIESIINPGDKHVLF